MARRTANDRDRPVSPAVLAIVTLMDCLAILAELGDEVAPASCEQKLRFRS
jgi:hypothetical protein